ncbi:hypothetical protein SAMN05216298_2240 [Glycomyces sambucus]|uniref:Uncharacterized protein n=1 Tax=Glycomyces sambucus TaxID=380244 RepID=A0A1G9GJ80_9ACTN|nr:hypothetical protein [Glycomyces sambucus]SDL00727.1 hypothetical protein SAMN05216298_2240 [Glycomyces sambucus]
MGASSWDYLVELDGSVEATLAALRGRSFDSGDWYWRPEDELRKGPKPQSLAEWEESIYGNDYPGAHSIVDMREIVRGIELDEIDQGQVLELSEQESIEVFGTAKPLVADWKRALEAGRNVWDLSDRDSGRCVLLADDSGRHWVAFWGSSGD